MTGIDERLLSVPAAPGSSISDYRQLLLSSRALIDVRAPVEFEKGAFPTFNNLPLMSDEERHLVGLRYKEQGQEAAIALGAKLVLPELQQKLYYNEKRFYNNTLTPAFTVFVEDCAHASRNSG